MVGYGKREKKKRCNTAGDQQFIIKDEQFLAGPLVAANSHVSLQLDDIDGGAMHARMSGIRTNMPEPPVKKEVRGQQPSVCCTLKMDELVFFGPLNAHLRFRCRNKPQSFN